MDGLRDNDTGIHGYRLNNLRFADDIDMMEERRDVLQANINILHTAGEAAGLRINIGKTKTLVFGSETIEEQMKVGNKDLENVIEFEYPEILSLLSWDNECGKEITKRIAKALGSMAGFNNFWKSKELSVETKLSISRTCIFSILLYACESWTLSKQDREKLMAFEMRCYRRILHIRWQQRITNEICAEE